MRRHGWAFCLGALLAGTVAAQPPTDEERYPPALDLPGMVVGQLPPPRPVDGPKDAPKTDAPKAEPKESKPADVTVLPNGTTPATPVIPVEPAPTPVTGTFPAANTCCPPARSGCHIGYADIREWFCFHSKARQTEHYVTPYRPPLQAWFPCEPKPLMPVAGPACAGCAAGGRMAPAPLAAGVVEGESVPTGEESTEPPLGGGVPIGKCLDAEVLTTFQPVNPGLLFTPGAAPTANPTTQVKPTGVKPK
jgi:hypothetical protein